MGTIVSAPQKGNC